MTLQIDLLAPDEIPVAAALTGRAMAPNPVHMAVFRQLNERTLRCQQAAFTVFFETFSGAVLAARRDGLLVGVCGMCRSPACQKTAAEARRLRPRYQQAVGAYLPRYEHWVTIWARHDPAEAHWHLGPVAVLPELQGQGVGSCLLAHFCRRVDESHAAAYLETDQEKNVRFYRRFGFAVTGTAAVYDSLTRFMWRPPA